MKKKKTKLPSKKMGSSTKAYVGNDVGGMSS
jgi:hypothetical protein